VSAADDVARMLTLIPWLLERQGASLAEVAAAFETDERTIRRDLRHLDLCGLPGLGGGDLFEVDIVGDRVLVRMAEELSRPLRPNPREALRLVLTLDAVVEVLGDELPALRSAVTKVRAALGIPEVVADVLEPATTDAVAVAREALRGGRRLRFAYQGRGDDAPQQREVDPWALHVLDGVWYLQGHDHGARGLRTFRLDRAGGLEVGDRPIEVAAPADLPPPRYAPGPDDLEVELVVANPAMWLLDALDAEDVEPGADATRVRLRTDAPGWVARLVLMAGGDARVVEPGELAASVSRMARDALARYRPAPGGD
jgi:proteasome accessory factor C